MRVVADTNVVISGLLWLGPSRRILDLAREGKIDLYTCPALLDELDDVLRRPKFLKVLHAAKVNVDDLLLGYASLAQVVHPLFTPDVVVNDPDDNEVLACAIACGAEYVVSGDSDLLNVKLYAKVSIMKARDFLDQLLIP